MPNGCSLALSLLSSDLSRITFTMNLVDNIGDRSFAVAAPRTWNKLPSPLRRVDSVNIFERQLKQFSLPRLLDF